MKDEDNGIDKEYLYNKCVSVYENPKIFPTMASYSVEEIYNILYSLELDKIERDKFTDEIIEYDDEIVSITEIGEETVMDITVSSDNLFYANGILTKNSFGLPATCDTFFGIIHTEEMKTSGMTMIKQLKNRFGDIAHKSRQMFNVTSAKFRLTQAEDDVMFDGKQETKPVTVATNNLFNKPKTDFDDFKFD